MDNTTLVNISIESQPKRIQYHRGKPSKPRPKKKITNPQAFTFKEDQFIIELVEEFGPKFDIIQEFFPSRNINHIKNRYYKYLRKNQQFADNSSNPSTVIEEEKVLYSHESILQHPYKEKKFINFLDELQIMDADTENIQIMSKLFSFLDNWVSTKP